MPARTNTPERNPSPRIRATPKAAPAERGKRRAAAASASAKTSTTTRAGSKQAMLVARLTEPAGATITDLTKELNWLPHTVRAALTRLRQQGYAVTRAKREEGDSVYRIAPPRAEKKRSRATGKNAA